MQIEDRYVDGTRLRLRTVREAGKAPVHKLGQKIRFAPGDASALAHTTLYLDEAENALLSALPAVTLTKTRHVIPLSDELDVAVDVLSGALSGLTVAELDLGETGLPPEPLPTWLGAEVTAIEEFTGYALACLDAEGLTRLLEAHHLSGRSRS
jgi:CYTH domain-containing protein